MKFRELSRVPLVLVALMSVIGAWAYPHLGARIPVHWNAFGQVDRWAPKSFANVFMPVLAAAGLYILFGLMPLFDPKRRNLLGSFGVYNLILDLVTGMFAVVFASTLAVAMGYRVPVDRIIALSVAALFIALGSQLGRVKQNWTMGVRYSWTLSDERVWVATNRLGGRLFVLAGVLGAIGAALPAPWGIVALIVPAVGVVPITYVYSMRMYRHLHPEERA